MANLALKDDVVYWCYAFVATRMVHSEVFFNTLIQVGNYHYKGGKNESAGFIGAESSV